MKTAIKFCKQEQFKGNTYGITSNPYPDYDSVFYSDISYLMVEFAKLHVTEALKQASEVAEDYGKETIAEKILESYSLDNIK